MTKGQQNALRDWVRSDSHRAADEEILADLPIPDREQILNGRLDGEQLAHQQSFIAGAMWYANEYLRKGRAPVKKRSQVHAKHLISETPLNPLRP